MTEDQLEQDRFVEDGPRQNRMTKERWLALAVLVVALAIIATLVAIAYKPLRDLASGLPAPTATAVPSAVPPTPTSIVHPGPVIVNAIRTEAKLDTYRMTMVNDQEIIRPSGIGNICTERIVYLGYYDVTAGVDLAKISEQDVSTAQVGDKMTITLTLPQAELIDVTLDTQRSHLVAQETPKWIPGCETQVASMTLEAQQRIKDYVTEAALQQGILQQAQEKAGFAVQQLLYKVGYPNVVIKYGNTP